MEPELPSSREAFPRFAYAVVGVAFAVVATTVAMVAFALHRFTLRTTTLTPMCTSTDYWQLVATVCSHIETSSISGTVSLSPVRTIGPDPPWSMGPPLVVLTLLVFTSVWLAYAIARLYNLRRSIAAVSAVSSMLLIYLSPMSVASSFTCEELAVPAILLMLWLTLCWLQKPGTIKTWWWMIDGVLLGALFWSKHLVIIPWVGILLASVVLAIRGQIPGRDLRRVIFLHLIGVAIASALILPSTPSCPT
jgi:hypothetical protein